MDHVELRMLHAPGDMYNFYPEGWVGVYKLPGLGEIMKPWSKMEGKKNKLFILLAGFPNVCPHTDQQRNGCQNSGGTESIL